VKPSARRSFVEFVPGELHGFLLAVRPCTVATAEDGPHLMALSAHELKHAAARPARRAALCLPSSGPPVRIYRPRPCMGYGKGKKKKKKEKKKKSKMHEMLDDHPFFLFVSGVF
jgi:hypothetical protein